MKHISAFIIAASVIAIMLSSCGKPSEPEVPSPAADVSQTPPVAYETLVWSDEFDGEKLDKSKWRAMLGTGPEEGYPENWGNNETQTYRRENAFVRDGNLVIEIKKEKIKDTSYTSARLTTDGLYSFTYGKAEARMKLPTDCDGLWPAFWMLPDGKPNKWKYGTWAASGEIDIMENRSRIPDSVICAVHFGGSWPDQVSGSQAYKFPSGDSVADWHVYTVEWFPDRLVWYVDGLEYFKLEEWNTVVDGVTYEKPKPFDQPFCLILNGAVGGDFDTGHIPNSDFTSAEILVDWVRVYQ